MGLQARIKSLIHHNYVIQKQRTPTNHKYYTYDSRLHTQTHCISRLLSLRCSQLRQRGISVVLRGYRTGDVILYLFDAHYL